MSHIVHYTALSESKNIICALNDNTENYSRFILKHNWVIRYDT